MDAVIIFQSFIFYMFDFVHLCDQILCQHHALKVCDELRDAQENIKA